MEVDGETVYACTARLEPREMTLAPLSNKKLVRDLVTEIAPPANDLLSLLHLSRLRRGWRAKLAGGGVSSRRNRPLPNPPPEAGEEKKRSRRNDDHRRKPVAFGDMRNWMNALKSAGELSEIDAESIGTSNSAPSRV